MQIWSAADLRSFSTMQVTAEQAGDAAQHGQVFLSGIGLPVTVHGLAPSAGRNPENQVIQAERAMMRAPGPAPC